MASNGLTLDDLRIKITVDGSKASSSISRIATALKKVSDVAEDGTKSLRLISDEIGHLAEVAKTAADSMSTIASAIKSIATPAKTTKAAVKDVSESAKVMGRDVAEGAEEAETSVEESAENIEQSSSRMSQAFESLKLRIRNLSASFGNLFAAMKRIAMYRAIRTAIKMITQSFKEGIENLVAWDKMVQNTSHAAETMENLRSTAQLLKNTLGAMAMPIIQLVVPILNLLADTVIYVANIINQFVRSMQGYNTYIKAVRGNTEKLTGATKELKRVLFGFDELNVLPSAAGSGNTGAWGGNFVETAIGEMKNTSALESAAQDLGRTMSGFFSEEFWSGLFKKESWVEAWETFKADMQEALDNLGESWGRIKSFFGMDEDTTFLGTTGWLSKIFGGGGGDGAGNAIGLIDKLKGTSFEEIKESFKNLFGNGVDGFLNTLFGGTPEEIWGKANDFLNDALGGTPSEVLNSIKEDFSSTWESVKNKASEVWEKIKEIWEKITGWFKEHITDPLNERWNAAWDAFYDKAEEIWQKVTETWGKISGWWKEHVSDPIKQKWEEIKQGAIDAWEGIKKPFKEAKKWFEDTFGEAWRKVKAIFSPGSETTEGIKEGISEVFKQKVNRIISGINSVIAVPFNAINSALDKIRNFEIFGSKPFEKLIGRVNVPKIPLLASGGFVPNVGSLFMAGENGAELVTHAPGGTEVMNGNQVEQAMTNANVEVINAIYAMANMVVGAVNNKNFDIYMDTQKVGKSVTQYQLNYARAMGV